MVNSSQLSQEAVAGTASLSMRSGGISEQEVLMSLNSVVGGNISAQCCESWTWRTRRRVYCLRIYE